MSRILIMIILTAACGCFNGRVVAQEAKDAKVQLKELVGKIQDQLKAGKNTETDMAPFMKEFDTLLEQHKADKSDEVARILLMKAMLYIEVLEKDSPGIELLKQLKTNFPETRTAKGADDMIAAIQKQQEGKKIQSRLTAGAVFPDFNEKDLDGKSLSIANFKGKVVLVDFWATWCGPCVKELPNVLKTYEKYHAKGFEIIGISLDSEEAALKNFIQSKGMAWPQYFDGKGWQNKLAGLYGVNSIPATYLLDGEGKIIAKNLREEALETEVGKALAKK